jgi:hypothetical protein
MRERSSEGSVGGKKGGMTNKQSEIPTTAAQQRILERYEDLRRQALCTADPVHRGSGLVMFIRQGMKTWMEAWSRCMPGVATNPQMQTSVDQVSAIEGSRELVSILASMALRSRWEARR